jgi:hypothetical protein
VKGKGQTGTDPFPIDFWPFGNWPLESLSLLKQQYQNPTFKQGETKRKHIKIKQNKKVTTNMISK